MPAERSKSQVRVHRQKNDSIRANAKRIDRVMTGYWEWFRIDRGRTASGKAADALSCNC
jgi:hypothetical protein